MHFHRISLTLTECNGFLLLLPICQRCLWNWNIQNILVCPSSGHGHHLLKGHLHLDLSHWRTRLSRVSTRQFSVGPQRRGRCLSTITWQRATKVRQIRRCTGGCQFTPVTSGLTLPRKKRTNHSLKMMNNVSGLGPSRSAWRRFFRQQGRFLIGGLLSIAICFGMIMC